MYKKFFTLFGSFALALVLSLSPCAVAQAGPADASPTFSVDWVDQLLQWLGLAQHEEATTQQPAFEAPWPLDPLSSVEEPDEEEGDRGPTFDPNG